MAAVVLIALLVNFQGREKRRLAAEASKVATEAGCTQVISEPDQGNSHLNPGQSFDYSQHPATSGSHDPGPLPADPHVHSEPIPETHAVHNLEHGYVEIYYRQEGEQALPDDVVTALENLADGERKVIMAPYMQLDDGQSLALAAWDRLQQCPSTVSSTQAVSLARAFIGRFRGDGAAPEPAGP